MSRAPLLRPPQPSRLAVLTDRAAVRRSGPSALVRETAALYLEERQAGWFYSWPVIALDIVWNLAFVIVSAVMLALTLDESPERPLRIWIAGYALQCVVYVGLVWTEYRRRRRAAVEAAQGPRGRRVSASAARGDNGGARPSNQRSSIAKRCESLNNMVSFLWWIVGCYWLMTSCETLQQDAPRLYWMTVAFLLFALLFASFCLALTCIIGGALCCCLPCIITIVYAVAGQEGASDADIGILPRYRYVEPCENVEKMSVEEGVIISMDNYSGSSLDERAILREDAECCICLAPYEDGVDLHSLPCNHHFHATCIVKWLRVNAICPLCKYNVLQGNQYV